MITIRGNQGAFPGVTSSNKATGETTSAFAKLSSGQRINKASDDAAALAIATQMAAELRSLQQATRNAYDGLALLETGDAGLAGTTDLLTRARELAVQASNGTLSDSQRGFIQEEIGGIFAEMDRVARATELNGKAPLDGSGETLQFQVGTQGGPDETLSVTGADATLGGLGLAGVNLGTAAGAQDALSRIDDALSNVAQVRARFGATAQQFESGIANLANTVVNTAAAHSRIMDTDVAAESARLAMSQIQGQASVSVLAQANQSRASILRLLGG